MGTHPIFESDFDCLTDKLIENGRLQVYERNLAKEAIGNDAISPTNSCLAIPKLEHHPSSSQTNSTRKGPTTRIQGQTGIRCIQNQNPSRRPKEARSQWQNYGQASAYGCLRQIRSTTSICR